MSARMNVRELLAEYRDGDEHGWETEFRNLMLNPVHASRLRDIAESAATEGIREPILLGNDGRVWEGHHRLCVAYVGGIESVPVEYASASDEEEAHD